MYYESYQSAYTGTRQKGFSKLWMDIDDILGDDYEDSNGHGDGDGDNDGSSNSVKGNTNSLKPQQNSEL